MTDTEKEQHNDKQDNDEGVTIEEAFKLAIEKHRNGHFEYAESIYRRILDLVPDHPDALHFLGIACHHTQRTDEAMKYLARSIEINPTHPDVHNNLGNVQKESGHLEEALDSYRTCLELQPDHADAIYNLGIVLSALGQLDEARKALEAALAIKPERFAAYHYLGLALEQMGKVEEAIAIYSRALQVMPNKSVTYRLLGMLYCRQDRNPEAVKLFEEWLAEEPDNVVAQHHLASCKGDDVPDRAADGYVTKVFDEFANTFDHVLESLEYHAPELVGDAVKMAIPEATASLDVLDAGCGTGLCAPLVRPLARALTGVDLSQGMVTMAEKRGGYDELVVGELTEFLRDHEDCYDLVISADTLCYFGSLEGVFRAASNALRPEGHLVFTVEYLADGGDDPQWLLNSHGRYCHAESYVSTALTDAGLAPIRYSQEVLRKEAGEEVKGLVVTARKS